MVPVLSVTTLLLLIIMRQLHLRVCLCVRPRELLKSMLATLTMLKPRVWLVLLSRFNIRVLIPVLWFPLEAGPFITVIM